MTAMARPAKSEQSNVVALKQRPAPAPAWGGSSWGEPVSDVLKLRMHDKMVLSRLCEETMIRMMRTGHGYFWIGAPGEEAWGVPLGMLVHKGYGPDHDYLHLHYRSSPTVLAMGAEPIDLLRQMRSTATDPYSKGRNFVNHFAIRAWNIVPVTPTIETQYVTAIGTGLVQRRHGGIGLSVITGGDAGSAEGDFASCLNWATRPGQELPLLILIAQNHWGISTPASQVQSSPDLAQRAGGYGVPHRVVDGNDPIASYEALREAMAWCREERKPYCLQGNVSRLYGHSSSSGALRQDERDCLAELEKRLHEESLQSESERKAVWQRWGAHLHDAVKQVAQEPMPDKSHVLEHVFAPPGSRN
jgi:2-oxoisovalerate dehydrogenase E1 component alpha subunit